MITIVSGLPRSGTSLMMQILAGRRAHAEAEGKAVKVISLMLLSLPEGHEYRVVFMQRPLAEVLASQEVMLHHRGTAKSGADNSVVAAAFEKNLRAVNAWLDSKAYVKTMRVPYHEVLHHGRRRQSETNSSFRNRLERGSHDPPDATLYRNRSR